MTTQMPPGSGGSDEPPSADEEVAKLRLHLRHTPLRALIDDGILRVDAETHRVVKGPSFDEAWTPKK